MERKEGETEHAEGAEEDRERERKRERNRGRTRVKEGRTPRVIYQRRRRCLINEAAKFGSFLFFCPPSSDHSVIHTLSAGRMEEEERVPRPMQGIPPMVPSRVPAVAEYLIRQCPSAFRRTAQLCWDYELLFLSTILGRIRDWKIFKRLVILPQEIRVPGQAHHSRTR